MCKHDQVFKTENESFGGWGCPLCHAERRRATMPPAGVCPVCGRNLTEHPHGWQECAADDAQEWSAYQTDRADNARPYLN